MQSGSQSCEKDVRDLERLTRLYVVLSRVNEAIIRTKDEQALFEAACKIAVEEGTFALAWIGFLDPETKCVRVAAKAGRDEGYLEQITISFDATVPEGQGPTAVALRECRPFVNNDTAHNPVVDPWRDEQLNRGFRSSAAFPLKVSGACIGVINLYASATGYFDEQEVRLLTALADDFSFALESTGSAKQREAALKELRRSQEVLARHAGGVALLKELAEIGASSLDVDETANRILDRLTERLRPKIATILVLDHDRKHLVPLALRGFTADYIEQHFGPVAVDGPGLSPAVFRSRKASYVADSETDPAVSEQARAFNRLLGVRAGVSAPLVARDQTIGTISFAWEAPRVMEADEIAFLESVASEAAVGLQNALLFEGQREAAHYADALNRMNDAIHSTLQIDEIMLRVVQEARNAMGADVAAVELREHEEWPVRYAAGSPEAVLGRPLTPERALMSLTVAARGAPVLVGDVMAEASFRDVAVKHGITAFAGVPLVVRGETLGVLLLVDYGRTRHFGDLERDFVGKVGASVSLALENARLYELAASARTNRVLAEISELLVSTADVEAAASQALTQAGGLLGAVGAVLTCVGGDGFIVTGATGRLEDLAGRRFGRDQLPSHAEALDRGHPILVGDVLESSEAIRPLAEERGIRSFAIYPLTVRGEETGTLAFAFAEPRESFNELEMSTMLRLAYTLSAALQNAELLRTQQQAARDAEALNRINDAIHSTLDFDEIMNRVVVEANAAFGSESASIVVKQGDTWTVRYATGFENEIVGLDIPEEQRGFMEAIERANEPLIVEDATKDPRLPAGWVQRFAFSSFLAVPLSVRGEVLGVMFFNFHREPRTISAAKADFARKLSPTVSLALGNSRLYDIERESARLNQALNTIDQDIHSTLSAEEIFARVVPAAATALQCESAAMGVREGDGWVVRYEYRLQEGLVGRHFSDHELQVARRAADEQDVQVVDDAAISPGVNQETRRLFDARSIMVVPLIAREEVVGVIYFIFRSHIHRFSSAEADFARRLSVSLGLAIVNARLFQAERDIADRLQEALLTLPEAVPGIEFSNAYHSASEAARVGGDFYDVFPLDHDHVGLVIGDVAGKGLDAAVLTSMVKNTLRAHATERGKTPKQIMSLTNDLVYGATPTESFVTVFFGILDCSDGRLVYSNAGHTTAAVIRTDGTAGKLPVTGPLLGAFNDVEFDQAEACLGLDELLFLYTDGLTEARRDGELYGEERLFAFLGSKAMASAQEVVHEVIQEVVAYTGNRLRDDLALLAVKRVQGETETPQQQTLEM